MVKRIKVEKCALNILTGTYQSPIFADKKYEYMCPDPSCNEKVFLKKGEKNIPHFCHKKNTNCKRYDTAATESELHKEAKHILRDLLSRDYNVFFEKKCKGCLNSSCETTSLRQCNKLNENEKIHEEYNFTFDDRNLTADLAKVSHQDDISEIEELYEIYNTHRTQEKDRPSYIRWYEVKAEEVCNKVTQIKEDKKIILKCNRVWQCEQCNLADDNEKKRLHKLEQDEYNRKCQRKEEEAFKRTEQQNKTKLIELNKDLKILGKKHDGKVNAYFLFDKPDVKKQKLQLDINTFIKISDEKYIELVNKHFPNYKFEGDYLKMST